MTIDDWKSSGRYVLVGDHRIFTQFSNNDREITLLLLHGFPTASWDWYKIWPELIRHFNVLTLDFLGFGFSDKPRNIIYSIDLQSDIVFDLIQNYNLKGIHVLAHDYGVSVAQELLARQLEVKAKSIHIESICFLNGGLFYEKLRPRFIQKLLKSRIAPFVIPFLTKATLKRNMIQIFGENSPPTQEEIDGFWELILYNEGKSRIPKLLHYLDNRKENRDRWVSCMEKNPVPMRLINGIEDPVSGLHMAEHYRTLIPSPDVVLLPDVGHYPAIEAPVQVIEKYFEFMQKQGFVNI